MARSNHAKTPAHHGAHRADLAPSNARVFSEELHARPSLGTASFFYILTSLKSPPSPRMRGPGVFALIV